jgi:deoxyribodipyrimidine photo-lyase
MIENARVRQLNDRRPSEGDYLLYWMQQSQRASFNQSLSALRPDLAGGDRP